MLTEKGTVVSVESDGLWVETLKSSSCAQCAAKKGCGQSLLATSVMSNMTQVKAYFCENNRRLWTRGDPVEIGISEHAMVLGTIVSYLVPLIFMVGGTVIASRFGEADGFAVAGAIVGLLLGGGLARWHSRRNEHNRYYHAVVLSS